MLWPKPYPALKAEADRIGLPLRFSKDLTTHDRAFCRDLPDNTPIAWMIYPDGTHIIRADRLPARFEKGADAFVRMIADTFRGVRFYFWDGMRLTECADAEALAAECLEEMSIAESAPRHAADHHGVPVEASHV